MSEIIEHYSEINTIITNIYNGGRGKRHNNLTRLLLKEKNIELAVRRLYCRNPKDSDMKSLRKIDIETLRREVSRRLNFNVKPKMKVFYSGGKEIKTYSKFDKLTQMCVLNILQPITEVNFYPSNFGYRPNMKPQHCISTFNNSLWACIHQGYEYYVITDRIDKIWKNIEPERVLTILRTRFGIYDRKLLFYLKNLMTSPDWSFKSKILGVVLTNCLLTELDARMAELSVEHQKYIMQIKQGRREYKSRPYERYREKYEDCFMVRYVRFGDKIALGFTYREDIPLVKDLVLEKLEELGLTTSGRLSTVSTLSKFGRESFIFIGYKVKTVNGNIRISISDLRRTYRKIRYYLDLYLVKKRARTESDFSKLDLMLTNFFSRYDICTNLEPLINLCNKYLFYRPYLKFKSINKVPNHDIYEFFTKDRGSKKSINLYELRKKTSLSYKKYVKVPYWNPNAFQA